MKHLELLSMSSPPLKVQYLGLRTPVYGTQISFNPGKGTKRAMYAFFFSFLTVFVLNLMVPGDSTWFWVVALGCPIGAVFCLFEDGEFKSKWWPLLSCALAAIFHFCQFLDD